jgi:hypothetical protein
LDRSFRGGINHPTQSKKPEFHRLVFVEGKTIREACDALGLSTSAADNWFRKMLALGQRIDHKCPCGKDLRHRGSCQFRQTYRADREKAGADHQTKGSRVLRSAMASSN